ncbi:hypothetical protein Tco_0752593, partial [Tanacetum coccineum]
MITTSTEGRSETSTVKVFVSSQLVRVGHLASLLSQVLDGALDSNVKSTLFHLIIKDVYGWSRDTCRGHYIGNEAHAVLDIQISPNL